MAGPQGGGQGQGQESGLGPLWIVVALFVAAYAIWYNFHAEITGFIIKVKIIEAYGATIFAPSAKDLVDVMSHADVAALNWSQISLLSTKVGEYYRIPICAMLLLLAGVVYFSSITMRYRKTYDMRSLVAEEVVNWPQTAPILKLDLIDIDIDQLPWAMSTNPLDFARRYKLLKEDTREIAQGKVVLREGRTMAINRGEAQRIFTVQLGNYWRGPEALPKHTQALFAAFASRVNHDVEASYKLLMNINRSMIKGKINFAGTDELLKKYYNTKPVQQILEQHAFVLTVMATLLERSRNDGVMASADFLWLKPMDRPLWYMLNNVGRKTACCEVAGVFAHWVAEKDVGRRLYVPMVEEAVNGLDAGIKNVLYAETDEELEEKRLAVEKEEKEHAKKEAQRAAELGNLDLD